MHEDIGTGVSDETTAKLTETARRNLRHFVGAATFKCEADRNAALSCLEVIEDRLDKAPANEPLPDAVEQSDYDLAEQVVSAANIVTNGGCYEIDIDAAAKIIARHRLSAMPASSGEVAQVVAWLRNKARSPSGLGLSSLDYELALEDAADGIVRGEHLCINKSVE